MSTHMDQDPYRRLVACHFPGSTLVGLDVLTGGVSAQAVSIDIAPADGRGSRFVVRRHSSIDTDRNPHIARDEFALLSALIEAGIPVPKPILFDSSRQLFPEPVIVLAFVQEHNGNSFGNGAGEYGETRRHAGRNPSPRPRCARTWVSRNAARA
ncbi:MAG: hypothetical protein R2839_11140 [Thermomicrobiales bacterium]